MWERTLSQKLVRLFCEQKVVDESKADAYVYGYELLISSVVSVLLVILVSAVCGDVRYSLSFLIGFIPQRIYIGGYHATSHTRCYLAFTGLALICILLSKVIAANHLFRILTTAALMGIAIFFSPIEATNKPLGKKKRLSYKMVASVLSSIDFLFAIFNVLPDTRSITVYYISKWVLVIFAIIATVYKGNIIKNLIMDCQSYTKYRPNETTGGIFVSWRRKEELPTGLD